MKLRTESQLRQDFEIDNVKRDLVNVTALAKQQGRREREVLDGIDFSYSSFREGYELWAVIYLDKPRTKPTKPKAYFDDKAGIYISADGNTSWHKDPNTGLWSELERDLDLLGKSEMILVDENTAMLGYTFKCIHSLPVKIISVYVDGKIYSQYPWFEMVCSRLGIIESKPKLLK